MNSKLAIVELKEEDTGGFAPRGAAKQLWLSKDHEVVLAGPAETGKTWSACNKLHALLLKYPGSSAVMIRKTLASLYPSCYQTYRRVVRADDQKCPLRFYGGEKPEWVDYPNNSRLFFAGMDNPQKALSSERDFVYANQLEEFLLDDWQTLSTRCTGRGAQSAPYSQMLGDANPGPPNHWILKRKSIRLLHSRHEDNPTLFDEDGNILPQGVVSLSILDNLSGVLHSRLRLGKWVAAEGVVYDEWDRGTHLLNPEQAKSFGIRWISHNGTWIIPDSWRRIRSIDFGYSNPFVCGWWAIDPDGRMFLYRQTYFTGRLVADHAKQIVALSKDERIGATVADHDAEDRATLAANGVTTQAAYKAISPGIQAVQQRLLKAGDGKPRLFVLENCLVEQDPDLATKRKPCSTEEEFEVYIWPKAADGKPVKEKPVDLDNHGMDMTRYATAYIDSLGGGWASDPAYWQWQLEEVRRRGAENGQTA